MLYKRPVRKYASPHAAHFTTKGTETEIILKDTDIILEADVELLEQVCINLLLNAVEAIKDVGKPHIIMSSGISNNRRTYIEQLIMGPV